MKVGELIKELSKYDSNLEIIFSREDDTLKDNRGFELYEFHYMEAVNVETTRLEDGTPYLIYNNASSITKLIIELTTDF